MKNTILLTATLLLILACSSQRQGFENKKSDIATMSDTVRIANDSLEYEIIIFEPGFNAWLVSQPPRGYWSQSAMEISNHFKVTEYNLRHQNPIRFEPNLYPFRIDYKRDINYGYEVNYLLFNYFRFFERKYQIKPL